LTSKNKTYIEHTWMKGERVDLSKIENLSVHTTPAGI
jgi:hypothetical protein